MLKGNTNMCSLLPNLMPVEDKQQISLPQKITIQQEHHQHYALKWSDYQSSILHCFQRLRDEEDFVDVTLSCDQRTFAAHRIVLSACSPYFRKLLKSNPCKHPIVILRDIRSDNMECLLSFMYNGEVNIRHDQLPDFLKTAHLLQIRGLTDVSENCYSSGCISSEGKSIDTLSANETCKLDSDKDMWEIESAEKCNYFEKYRSSSERQHIPNSKSTGVYSSPSKETKTSATACLQWENADVTGNRKQHLTPPPQKRIKSADLFRAQHGISSDCAISQKEFSSFVHNSLTRDRKQVEQSEIINFGHIKTEKLQPQIQHIDNASMQEESSDEDSNSSNEDASDRDDKDQRMNDSTDEKRTTMHNIFLGVSKPVDHPSVINLTDIEFPEEISSNMLVKPNTSNSKTHPFSTVFHSGIWNLNYEDILGGKSGFTDRSGDQNNSSTDSFMEKSTALSIKVKTARLKSKSNYLEENVPAVDQEHLVKSKSENNKVKLQYDLHKCFGKQPLYEYLYELQKSAVTHKTILDSNLVASQTFDTDKPELVATTTADTGLNNLYYKNSNSYWLPCPLCEAPLEQKLFRQHLDDHYPRDSHLCPVIECGRRFAHPNSVRNHMRIKHTQQWAKMKVMRSAAGPLPNMTGLNTKCSQRSGEMRVRATDPRPCPKCGKIYRSAHTLRTHLEDKHTVCPGYRCVLCGTVAKSRNSLHSHMSRQHRGISTKDLPVLPMPCAFDPALASSLLTKAGVKISLDDLNESGSTINSNNASVPDYSANSRHNIQTGEKKFESDDDAEDLTAGTFCNITSRNDTTSQSFLDIQHANTTMARLRNEAAVAAAAAALSKHKELSIGQSTPTQPLLDLHLLQLITKNTFGMGISQDRTTESTLHAAKVVQLNAIGQGLESLPSTMMHPIANKTIMNKTCGPASLSSEPILRQQLSSGVSISEHVQQFTSSTEAENSSNNTKKDDCEPTQNSSQ